MMLSRLMGGLGNQMFQYALGRTLAKRNKTNLKIDLNLLLDHSSDDKNAVHRGFDLDIFRGPFEIATLGESEKFNGKPQNNILLRILNRVRRFFKPLPLIIEKDRRFDKDVLQTSNNKCLIGAWQSENYFKEIESEIREAFNFVHEDEFRQSPFYKLIENNVSVSFHVRRGDYVSNSKYSELLGEQPITYFEDAYNLMESKCKGAHYFIFSDDIDWCKQNLKFIENLTFVESPKNKFGMAQDLFLMTQCLHNVISHSTFSWWGAWLNQNKTKKVVVPKNWVSKKYLDDFSIHPKDIVPENWIRI